MSETQFNPLRILSVVSISQVKPDNSQLFMEGAQDTRIPFFDKQYQPGVDPNKNSYFGNKTEKTSSKDPEISIFDVRQGTFKNNCGTMAAIASVASQNPQHIRDMIKDNGDGSFTVKLFNPITKSQVPDEVKVTYDEINRSGNALGGNRSKGKVEIWPSVIETAMDKYSKSFAGSGAVGIGSGTEGLGIDKIGIMLTGNEKTEFMKTKDYPPKFTLEKAEELLKTKSMIVVMPGMQTTDADSQKATRLHLVPTHAYALKSVDKEKGTIDLYNPWGGTVTLKEADLDVISYVAASAPPPKKSA